MVAVEFDYSLACNSTCSSRSCAFSVPCEEQWYMAARGVAEMSVATGECLSVCLSPLLRSHPPPSLCSNFHFILMSAHSQTPNMKLCVKLEDECIVSVSTLYQTSTFSTILSFNIVWLWRLSLTFVRIIVIILNDSLFAFEGHLL